MRKIAMLLALCLPAAAPLSARAVPPGTGKSYICDFGPHGTVVIDTRYPGATITIDGKVHPAQHGSYFYQTQDGDIAVMFGPDRRFWEYRGVRDDQCVVKNNRRDDSRP
jgi:hypothetical protein